MTKIEELITSLRKYLESKISQGICLAFSGGVDSSLLLCLLAKINVDTHLIVAATFNTELLPTEDSALTKDLARLYKIKHQEIFVDVLSNENVANNPSDRCYHCKKQLFTALQEFAVRENLKWLLDGTNADDLNTYRPGLKALKELGVCSPLAELGVTKQQVRELSKHLQIPVAHRPSAPCLATRFTYNTRLDKKLIAKVDEGERFIKESFGINDLRLRLHDDVVRIEVESANFKTVIDNRVEITQKLKSLSFKHVTLDLSARNDQSTSSSYLL